MSPYALFLAAVLAVPFILFSLGYIDWIFFAAGLGIVIYAGLLLVNIEIGFLILIFLRSSLDYFRFTTEGTLNAAALVTVGLIVLSLFYVLYRKINILKFEESGPWLIFLAASALSFGISKNLAGSLADWLRLSSIFAAYLMTRTLVVSEKKAKVFFLTILLSSLIPMTVALYQWGTDQGVFSKDFEYGRLAGTFSHPNAFSSYLLIILVFNLVLILEKQSFIAGKLLFLHTAFCLFLFVMTFSRGAWIVFVISMLFIGFLRYRKVFILMPILAILALVFFPAIGERLEGMIFFGAAGDASSITWRQMAWSNAMELFLKNPLLGNGLGMISYELGYRAHNDYVRLLAETGVVGIVSYFFLVYGTIRRSWKDYKKSATALAKALNLALLAILLGFVVRQYADNTLRHTVVMIYLWILIAITRNISGWQKVEKP